MRIRPETAVGVTLVHKEFVGLGNLEKLFGGQEGKLGIVLGYVHFLSPRSCRCQFENGLNLNTPAKNGT